MASSTFYTYTPLLIGKPSRQTPPAGRQQQQDNNPPARATTAGTEAMMSLNGIDNVGMIEDDFFAPPGIEHNANPDEDLIFTEGMLLNFMEDAVSFPPHFRNTACAKIGTDDIVDDVSQCFFPFSRAQEDMMPEKTRRSPSIVPGGQHLTRMALNFDELESVVSGGSASSFDDSAKCFNRSMTSIVGDTCRQRPPALESHCSADVSLQGGAGFMNVSDSHSPRSAFPTRAIAASQRNYRRISNNNDSASLLSGTRSGGVWPKTQNNKEARKQKKAIAAKKYRQERNEYVKVLETKNQELGRRVATLEAQLRQLEASRDTAGQ